MTATPVFRLVPETAEDETFLRRLYRAIRWAEIAAFPFDEAGKCAFLDDQFTLQRTHYRTHYDGAAFNVIMVDGQPAGRLYLHRGERDHRIIDISLLPEMSGRGIGGAVLDRIMADAAAAGCGVSIHVEGFNPARSLYDRKGFREIEQRGPYWLMEWFPEGVPGSPTTAAHDVQLNTAW